MIPPVRLRDATTDLAELGAAGNRSSSGVISGRCSASVRRPAAARRLFDVPGHRWRMSFGDAYHDRPKGIISSTGRSRRSNSFLAMERVIKYDQENKTSLPIRCRPAFESLRTI